MDTPCCVRTVTHGSPLAHVDRRKTVARFHGCGALRLKAGDHFMRVAMSVGQAHQRLARAAGVIAQLRKQLRRVTART